MKQDGFERPSAGLIASYVKRNAPAVKKAATGMAMHMGHGSGMESIRKDIYQGHSIVVRTSYKIEVDGKEIMAHLALTNDGQVQYHGLPNYSFDSAVGLVKKMIDVYPDDFAANQQAAQDTPIGQGADMNMPMENMPMKQVHPEKHVAAKPAAKRRAKTKTAKS